MKPAFLKGLFPDIFRHNLRQFDRLSHKNARTLVIPGYRQNQRCQYRFCQFNNLMNI